MTMRYSDYFGGCPKDDDGLVACDKCSCNGENCAVEEVLNDGE